MASTCNEMPFWHEPQSNILLYDVPDAVRILPHLDGGVQLHNGYMAVPVNLRNCQVLRHFKLPVIPLVDLDYDWPIRKPFYPREHQKIMTNFMVCHPHSLNLSDMGTMKTLATLWACDYLMLKNPGMRVVIAAPVSILQRVWGDAITQHFLGRRTFTILRGDHKRRRKCLEADSDFYIMGHDALKQGATLTKRHTVELSGLSKDIVDRTDIQIGVIDEASAFRDGQSMRSRVARTNIGTKPYFWPLTGTPTPNGPLDAHGVARLINGANGESFTHYKKRIMYQLDRWVWRPRPGAHEEAFKLMQPSIRFEMRECTDVPPCTEQMRDVELSYEQEQHIKDLKRDLQIVIDKGAHVVAVNEAALRLKLIQISCGAVYDTNHKATRIDCGPRLAELRAVIEEARRKVIVFTPLTSIVHMLYEKLTEYSRAMINGEIPLKVRDEIFRRFQQEEDPQVLIADPATMSHGLDLFAASVVVWYGATDRTELYLQANRRIDRPGQVVPTTIVQLAATAVEREIFKRAASNVSMQGAILQLVREQ
jgi:SNF2-related domain/Helicase conserved C-terminal domain